jgi:collagen type XII alpha
VILLKPLLAYPGPLGGVRNLQVTNPTMTTLNVKWEPADGKVKVYNVFYVPAAGGAAEAMVGRVL